MWCRVYIDTCVFSDYLSLSFSLVALPLISVSHVKREKHSRKRPAKCSSSRRTVSSY